MKTRLAIIIACMMSILASCTHHSPADDLHRECEAASSHMPQDMGNSIIALSVTYADGDVVYRYSCDETVCPLYDQAFVDQVAEQMRQEYLNSDVPEIAAFVDLCRQAGANIVNEYATLQGHTYRIVIPLGD